MRECTLGRPFARAFARLAMFASALAIFVAAPARAEDVPFHKQVDLAPLDASDPRENFAVIERELERHDPRLARLPRILVLSKADLVPPETAAAAAEAWRARLGEDVPVLVTSKR